MRWFWMAANLGRWVKVEGGDPQTEKGGELQVGESQAADRGWWLAEKSGEWRAANRGRRIADG
jgi:hypothetical protein